jgi:hypothetical protein
MKIAVLESHPKKINGHLKSFNTVSYSNLDSLLEDFSNYDAIIIDKEFITLDIMKMLKEYGIETIILNAGKINFDCYFVTEIVDYSEIDLIKEKMQYVETKLKIKKLLEEEQKNWKIIEDFSNKVSVFAAVI